MKWPVTGTIRVENSRSSPSRHGVRPPFKFAPLFSSRPDTKKASYTAIILLAVQYMGLRLGGSNAVRVNVLTLHKPLLCPLDIPLPTPSNFDTLVSLFTLFLVTCPKLNPSPSHQSASSHASPPSPSPPFSCSCAFYAHRHS
jgi:hypothetical protein